LSSRHLASAEPQSRVDQHDPWVSHLDISGTRHLLGTKVFFEFPFGVLCRHPALGLDLLIRLQSFTISTKTLRNRRRDIITRHETKFPFSFRLFPFSSFLSHQNINPLAKFRDHHSRLRGGQPTAENIRRHHPPTTSGRNQPW